MNLYERLNPRVTPGTMSNPIQRRNILKAVRSGGLVPKWVGRAMTASLPVMRVGGVAR